MFETFINYCWIVVSVLIAILIVLLVILFVEKAVYEEKRRRELEKAANPIPDFKFDGYSRWELSQITASIFRNERRYRKKKNNRRPRCV